MNFFQTMRLLHLSLDNPEKMIQLRSVSDLQFSAHDIRTIDIQKNAQNTIEHIILTVAFMGIAGTQG